MGSCLCHCFSSVKKEDQFTPEDPGLLSYLLRWIFCCRVSSIVARLMGKETLEETIDDEILRHIKTKSLRFHDYDEEKHSLLEMNITPGRAADLTAMNFDDSDEDNNADRFTDDGSLSDAQSVDEGAIAVLSMEEIRNMRNM